MKFVIMKFVIIIILFNYAHYQEHYETLDFICDSDGDGRRNEQDCKEFKSFANDYLSMKDYRGSVDMYKTLILCGCKDINSTSYMNLAKGFDKLSILDSAAWAVNQGFKFDSENDTLLDWGIWILSKQIKKGEGNLDDLLFYFDKKLELNPKDLDAFEKLSDTYKNNKLFEEQIEVLDNWLRIEPNSKKAINNKKYAYNQLGYDESEVDKERWEKETTNLEYGISYINSLLENENFEKAINISEEVIVFHSNDKRLLALIADAYIKNLDDKKAIKYLEELISIDSNNTSAMLNLSRAYVNIEDFNKAYSWSNKAISSEKLKGKSFFQRADVLVQLVDYYRQDDLDFCDRLVYDLAMEDYKLAYDNGQLNARIYMNNLNELGTTISDWFLLGDQYNEISPNSNECIENIKNSDCYNFISRSVKRK